MSTTIITAAWFSQQQRNNQLQGSSNRKPTTREIVNNWVDNLHNSLLHDEKIWSATFNVMREQSSSSYSLFRYYGDHQEGNVKWTFPNMTYPDFASVILLKKKITRKFRKTGHPLDGCSLVISGCYTTHSMLPLSFSTYQVEGIDVSISFEKDTCVIL